MAFTMALISSLRLSIKNWGIHLVFMVFGIFADAQQWELLDSLNLELPVRMVSADRLNNIYINDTKGNIRKLDSLGRPLALYAPQQFGMLTSLETWASLRVFLFYEDTQRYTFLDRYLADSEFSEFPAEKFGFVRLAASSSDNQIWLLDLRPLSLTKFDMTFNEVSFSQSLNQLSDTLDLHPYQLVEYQNRVYLGDNSIGVLVFDNLGNFLRTLPKPESSQFHLWEKQLYYLTGHHLHFLSLYSDQEQSIKLPARVQGYQHVLFLGSKIMLISGNQMFFFRYSPL